MKSPTARTTPGITTGVRTRKARIWWPAISFRLVTYASSAASAAPTQAVSRPSSSVLTMADRVDVDMNTSDQLARVRFSPVRGWAQARAKAALASMPYGRKTAQAMTARQPPSAG